MIFLDNIICLCSLAMFSFFLITLVDPHFSISSCVSFSPKVQCLHCTLSLNVDEVFPLTLFLILHVLYPFLEPMRKVCYSLGLASLSTTCVIHKVHRALLAAQTEGLGWCKSPKSSSRCLLDSWTVTRALTR